MRLVSDKFVHAAAGAYGLYFCCAMSSPSKGSSVFARLMQRLRGEHSPTTFTRERASSRFPIQLPIRVKYGAGLTQDASGTTENLSVGGVFFVTPDAIPQGADIELLLPVPPPLAKEGKMWMFCTAQVVRAQQAAEGLTGVGALIRGYKVLAEA